MSMLEQLTKDPGLLDRVLNPGRFLHEATPESLEIKSLSSGFPSLDHHMLLKESEGELIVVAGETSMGKSALMLQIAFHVSKCSFVHIFSLEDSYENIVRRRVAALLKCPIDAVQQGRCRNDVADAIKALQDYNYFVDDEGGLTVEEICDRARNKARTHKTKLIAIDYLQIVGVDARNSRALEIGRVTTTLKSLAKELKTPILLASQMNRQFANREDQRPRLSDLKESSSIEQDADIVVSVYREYRRTGRRPDEADIGVLKNRNGPIGDTIFKFFAERAEFQDLRSL